MKSFVFFMVMVLAVLAQKTTLAESSPEMSKTIYPPNKYTILDEQVTPNFLGEGTQTIWINGDRTAPIAIFETPFYADCPHVPAQLIVSQDDKHVIYLNGKMISYDGSAGRIDTYKIDLQCGLNNLTIKVINIGGPGWLIFKVQQEQGNCFERSGAVYDYKTCSFKCTTTCNCPEGRHWAKFPVCGCQCNGPQASACNHNTQRFDRSTCSCICRTNICPPGLEQDTDTCECRCKAKTCAASQQWNYYSCSCEAASCIKTACSGLKIWSQETCGCICPNNIACPSGQELNSATCSCS